MLQQFLMSTLLNIEYKKHQLQYSFLRRLQTMLEQKVPIPQSTSLGSINLLSLKQMYSSYIHPLGPSI